jgi:hypothetical protein
MSAAVKPNTERSASAFVVSVALHGSMLLFPILGGLSGPASEVVQALPNSVALVGNSIEVEAPTPELAATPGAAAPAAEPAPVDVKELPTEAEPPPVAKPAAEVLEKAAPVAARPAKPRVASKSSLASASSAASANSASSASSANSASTAAVAAGAEAPTSGAPAAGTFGQEGLAPGVRRLGYAFTRAIPAATPADAEWRELPAGKVGTIRIELEVDENNRLGTMKQWQARAGEPAPPAVLRRMVERTLLLLRAGQFALSGSNQPGAERLVIEVQLRDEAAEGEGESVVVQKGFDGASPGRPGRAHFRYGNGRAFEARVTIVPAAPR